MIYQIRGFYGQTIDIRWKFPDRVNMRIHIKYDVLNNPKWDHEIAGPPLRGVHRGRGTCPPRLFWGGNAPPPGLLVFQEFERESTTEIGKEKGFDVNWAVYLASAKVLIIIYVPGGGQNMFWGGGKPPKIFRASRENIKPRFARWLVNIFKKVPTSGPNPVYAPA